LTRTALTWVWQLSGGRGGCEHGLSHFEALTAWATAGAVIVALYFGVRSELRTAWSARRAQATHVSAWLEVDEKLAHFGGGPQPVVVVVRNASDALAESKCQRSDEFGVVGGSEPMKVT